jgi:hypothetical protein
MPQDQAKGPENGHTLAEGLGQDAAVDPGAAT